MKFACAHLWIWVDGGEVKASCQIGLWASHPAIPVMNVSQLADRLMRLKNILPPEVTSIWLGLEDPLAEPTLPIVKEEFLSCVERTISEGSSLFIELSGHGLEFILKKLTAMPNGSRLTIHTDCAFFPWEILYPQPYNIDWPQSLKDNHPYDRTQLWGYRFITDYRLITEDKEGWAPPIEEHKSGAPFVSLNLNPTIDDDFATRPFKPIQFHEAFYQQHILPNRGGLVKDGDSIFYNLISNTNATVIYIFCHGSNSAPFTPKGDEVLKLDDTKEIGPTALNAPGDNAYRRGPIMIINSCLSATPSPLSLSSFHAAFRKKKAMGIIGTAMQIPATFAAAFGRKLIESYLDGVPIGVAIYRLRKELLEKSNPLGLYYSLQCPIEITAPKG